MSNKIPTDLQWADLARRIKAAGGQITVDSELSTTSENPVQNKIITTALNNKANTSAIPTKTSDLTNDSNFATTSQIPTKVSDLTNDSDFQTETEVSDAIDAKISSTYKAGGSVAFANLPTLGSSYEGFVYNITDDFTTTADFVEGAGNDYPAGTNVAVINLGTAQSAIYRFDVLAGFVDLSNYAEKSEIPTATSDLTNDSGFITSSSLPAEFTTQEWNALWA